MTEEIIKKLDLLAEYQAQVDLLELQKRELLDAVKIPDEVLAAQDEANKRRQKADSDALKIQKEIQATTVLLMSEIEEPEMPPEYAAALAAVRAQREDIQSQASARYEALQKKQMEVKAKIDADLQSQIREVYAQVELRKAEINSEFSGKAEAAKSNIDKLTAEIKAAVIRVGKTVKGSLWQAVFTKGRVTWNTEKIDGAYFALNSILESLLTLAAKDESLAVICGELGNVVRSLNAARKEGEPSVSMRRV